MKNKIRRLSFFLLVIALTSVQVAKAGTASGGTSFSMATVATMMMLKTYEPDLQQLQVPDSIKKELPLSLDFLKQSSQGDQTHTREQGRQPPEFGPAPPARKELRTRKIQKQSGQTSSEPGLPDSIPAYFRQQADETYWDELTEYASDFGWNAFMALGPAAAGILTDYLMKSPELADKAESLTDWTSDIYDSPSLSVFLQYLITSYLPKRALSDVTGYSFLIFNMSLICQFYSDVVSSFSQHQGTFPVLMTETEMARHFRIQLINRHKLEIEFLGTWGDVTTSTSDALVPFIKLHQAARAANVHKITLLTDSTEGKLAAAMQMHQPEQVMAPVMLEGNYGDTDNNVWLNESFYNRQISSHQELSYTYMLYDWRFGEEQRAMVNPLALPMIDYLTRHLLAFKTSGENMMPFHNPIFQRVDGNMNSDWEHTPAAAGLATTLFAGEIDLRSVEQHAYELLIGNEVEIPGTTPINSQRFTTAIDNLLIDNFTGSEILYLTPGLNVTEADLQQLDARRYDSSFGWKYLFHFAGVQSMAQLLQRKFISHLLRGMTRAYQHSKHATHLKVAGAGGGGDDEDGDPEPDKNRKRTKKLEKEKPDSNPFNGDNNDKVRKAAPMTGDYAESEKKGDSGSQSEKSTADQPATLVLATHTNNSSKRNSDDDDDDDPERKKKKLDSSLPKDKMGDAEPPKKKKKDDKEPPAVKETLTSKKRAEHIHSRLDQQPPAKSRDELIQAAQFEEAARKSNLQFPRNTMPTAIQSMFDLRADPSKVYKDRQARYDQGKEEARSLFEEQFGHNMAWTYASSLHARHDPKLNQNPWPNSIMHPKFSHSRTSSAASNYSDMTDASSVSMTSVTSAARLEQKMAARNSGPLTLAANTSHRSSGQIQVTKGFRTQGEIEAYLKQADENVKVLNQELSEAKEKYNRLGTVTRPTVRKEHRGKVEASEIRIQHHYQNLLTKTLDQTSELTGRVYRLETGDEKTARRLSGLANETSKLKRVVAQIPADVINGEIAGQITAVREIVQHLTERVSQDEPDIGAPKVLQASEASLKNAARQEVTTQLEPLQQQLNKQLKLTTEQLQFQLGGRLSELEESLPQLRQQLDQQGNTEFFANEQTQKQLSALEATVKEATEQIHQELEKQKAAATQARKELNEDFQAITFTVEASMKAQQETQGTVEATLKEFNEITTELQQANKDLEAGIQPLVPLPARVTDLEEQARDFRKLGSTIDELRKAADLQDQDLNEIKAQLKTRADRIETKQAEDMTTLKQASAENERQIRNELETLNKRQSQLQQSWEQQVAEFSQQYQQSQQLATQMATMETRNEELTALKKSTTESREHIQAELTRLDAHQNKLDESLQQQMEQTRKQQEEQKVLLQGMMQTMEKDSKHSDQIMGELQTVTENEEEHTRQLATLKTGLTELKTRVELENQKLRKDITELQEQADSVTESTELWDKVEGLEQSYQTSQQQLLKKTKQQVSEIAKELSAEKAAFRTKFDSLTENLQKHQRTILTESSQLHDDMKLVKKTLNIDTGAGASSPADAQRLLALESKLEQQLSQTKELNSQRIILSNQLASLDSKLSKVSTRQNNVESKVKVVDILQGQQKETTARLDKVVQKQTALHNRAKATETKQDEQSAQLTKLARKHDQHVERFNELDGWYIETNKSTGEKVYKAHEALTEAKEKKEQTTEKLIKTNEQLLSRIQILETKEKTAAAQLEAGKNMQKLYDAELNLLNRRMNQRMGVMAVAIPAASLLTYLASGYTGLYMALHPHEVINRLKYMLGEGQNSCPGPQPL